ncbi:MAG: ATP-binding protein [Polyangiaceae bacterium]
MLLREEGSEPVDVERLRREVKLLRGLLEGSSDMVDVLDETGRLRVEFQGRHQPLGYARGELVGRNVFELVHPEDEEEVRGVFERLVRRTDTQWTGHVRFRHKDGHFLTLEVLARTLTHDTDVDGVVVYGTDVTEKHALRHRLNQAARVESVARLASSIAHDFNNLLSVIAMGVVVVRRDSQLAGVALDEIEAGVAHGRDLIKRLFSFGTEVPRPPKPLALATEVRRIAGEVRPLLSAEIRLEVHAPDESGFVLIDPVQLEQILLNLALNARDAMPSGGRLVLRVEPGETRHRVLVTDTGVGMDEATSSRVFEPFFTTKDASRGTGLGLASVSDAVTAAGGSISLRSTLGEGTTFTLEFPAAGC